MSITMPLTRLNSGVQAGSVKRVTKISPACNFSAWLQIHNDPGFAAHATGTGGYPAQFITHNALVVVHLADNFPPTV